MLRVEDCKPGVEVIAISNKLHDIRKPALIIGNIYVIESFHSHALVENIPTAMNCVCLEGIGLYGDSERRCGYVIENFKLRNREELISLFNLKDIPQELYSENYDREVLADVKD